MVIPFKISFYENKKLEKSISFATSFEEAIEHVESYSVTCEELHDFRVKFESDLPNLTLWIELMDVLPKGVFKNGEDDFFYPSCEIRPLYLNSKSDFNVGHQFSSFLPGLYRIIVLEEGREKYFAFLKVEPLHVDEGQLELMQHEVEHILKGLAKEVALKKRAVTSSDETEDLLRKYQVLMQETNHLIATLKLICKNPRYTLEKLYVFEPKEKVLKKDTKTIRQNQIHVKKGGQTLTYKYILNYDISFNRNLKFILIKIQKIIKEVEVYIAFQQRIVRGEIENQKKYRFPTYELERNLHQLEKNAIKINHLKVNVIFMLKQPWLEFVDPRMDKEEKLPRIPYYRFIYSVYQQLKKNVLLQQNPFAHYIHIWKESSKLYELWGFIKVLLMLKDNEVFNFTDISGWIFDKSQVVHPVLEPGTLITLKNDDQLILKLRYDSVIGKEKDNTSEKDPILTLEKNNRPDLRIDIYYKNTLRVRGCIILEFKYRQRESLGNLKSYLENRSDLEKTCYVQLKNYTKVKSWYKYKERGSAFMNAKVFAVFPMKPEKTLAFEEEQDSGIIFCSLSPTHSTNEIENAIIQIIKDIVDDE